MPYISVQDQARFVKVKEELATVSINTSGELNYLLTITILSYLRDNGKRYATMNDIVGALDGAKIEFQRRVVNPYEDQKAFDVALNGRGDMYEEFQDVNG